MPPGQSLYERAKATGDEMLALAEPAGDSVLLVEAYRVLGNTAFWTGDFDRACTDMRRAVMLYDPTRHQSLAQEFGQDPDVANRGILCRALCYRGLPLAAEQQVQKALQRAQTIGHPFSRVFAGGSAMWSAWFLDQPDKAERHAAATRDICLERGFPYLTVASRVVHGWAVARNRQTREGLAEVEAAIAGWRAGGTAVGMVIFLLVPADVQTLASRPEQALVTLANPLTTAPGCGRWLAAGRPGPVAGRSFRRAR